MLERIDRRVSQALTSQNRILKSADRAWLAAERVVGRAFTYLFGRVPVRGLLEAQAGSLGIKSVSPEILMTASAGGGSLPPDTLVPLPPPAAEILPGVTVPRVPSDTIANCKKAVEGELDEHQRVHADFQAASGKIDQTRFKWLRTIIVSTATAAIGTLAFPFVGAIGLSLSAPVWVPFVLSGLEFFATALGLQGAVYGIRYGIRKHAYNKKDTALINCESRIYEFMSEPLYKEVLAATLYARQKAGNDTSNILDLFTGEEKEGLVAIVNAYKAFGTLTQESNPENIQLATAARNEIPSSLAIHSALGRLILSSRAAAEPPAPPRTEPLPPPRPPVGTSPFSPFPLAPDYVAPPPGAAALPPVVTLSPLRPTAEPPAPPPSRIPEAIRIVLGKTYRVVPDLVRLKEAMEDLAQLTKFSATTDFKRLPADDQDKINQKMVLVTGPILPMQKALGLVLTGKDASGKEVNFIIDAAETPNGSQLVPNGVFIGRGGMAEVYRGVEAKSRIPIAVKIITDPDSDKRAELEAFAPQAIKNPHVIEIYAFGKTTFGRSFIAMELFGKSLAELLNEGRAFSSLEAVKAVLQILDGLKAAHEKRIYHRDLKPANVFVRQETKPDGKKSDVMALADWGMVKSFQEGLRSSQAALTKGLEMLGTPSYTPPENAYFKSLDLVEALSKTEPPDSILSRNGWLSRVDIYAVGCILYELINRHDPIKIDSMETLLGDYSIKIPAGDLFPTAKAIAKQNSGEELPPDERRLLNSLPANIERWKAEVANQIAENRARIAGEKKFKIERGIIDEHLFPIVEKMLAYDPQRRYAKVEDVIRDLEKFLRGEPLVPEAVSKKTVHLGPAATPPSAPPARSVVGGSHSIKVLFAGDQTAFKQDLEDIFYGTDPSKVAEALRDPEATRQRILAKNRSLPYDPDRDALANDVIGMLFSLKK